MKKYDSYKDSGIEWIGEVPSHWNIKPLFSIASKNKEKNSNLTENNVLSLSYGNIVRRDISDNFGLLPDSFDTYQIVENGMLVLRLTDLQNDKKSLRVGLVKERGIITSAYIGLIFEGINPTYAYYLLHDYDIQKVFYNFGSGVRQMMSFSDLKRLPIIKPNKEEQTIIANYLDQKITQIEDLIAKKERLIQLLEEERTAIINQAVTKGLDPNVSMKDSGIEMLGEIPEHWEMAKIKRLSTLISKGTTPSTVGKEVSDNGEIRYLKSENIVDNQLLKTPEFYIDNETNQILKRSMLEINDVLIVIAGASIGKVAILTDDFCPSNTNQAVSFIRLKNPNSSCFVWYWLQSSYIKERISLDATQSAQPNLSMESIGNFYIPKISVEEEQDIITFLTQKTKDIDVIISKTKQEIELLKEYKTALISEVVTGKVDVRNEKFN